MKKYIEVLRSEIPNKFFGRPLTQTEIRELRKLTGSKISNRAIVVREFNSEKSGTIYNPSITESGYENTFINVSMK